MTRLSDQSLYEILEVDPSAPVADIEKAYERAKGLYGPGSLATYTLVAPEEAALLLQRLEEARTVLCDSSSRAAYNARLGLAAPPDRAVEARPFETSSDAPSAPAPAVVAPELIVLAASPIPSESPAAQIPPPSVPVAAPSTPPAAVAPQMVIPDDAIFNGAFLRRVRESKGIALKAIAEKTRVGKNHLENIEADRYSALPAPVYLRGILMSYAKELKLDAQKVARSYLDAYARASAGG